MSTPTGVLAGSLGEDLENTINYTLALNDLGTWSGSHLLKKPHWGFPDSGWLVSGSRYWAVIFVALPVDGFFRITAVGGFPGVSIAVVAVSAASGGLGVAGATSAAAGDTGAGLTGNNPGEDSGVAGPISILVGVWMTLIDVVMCTSVLSSPNDLYQAWAMAGLMDHCGWEPEGLDIIEYKEFVLHIVGTWAWLMIMVYSTLGGMVMVSCSLGVLVPDPLRHDGSYCSLVKHFIWGVKVGTNGCTPVCQQGKVGILPWVFGMGEETPCNLDSCYGLAITPQGQGELVLWSKFHPLANSLNWWLASCGPLSDLMVSGIPCSKNNSLSIVMVLVALHCNSGNFLMNGILEN